jgi:hypothetical protein
MSSARTCVLSSLIAVAFAACGDSPAPAGSAPPPSPPPAQAAPARTADTPTAAVGGLGNDATTAPGLTDDDMPPLPAFPFPAAAPMDIVHAVFTFAAKHPEVLNQVPCFCGCETSGHRHNDDCFVKARDARGRPTEWELHGAG